MVVAGGLLIEVMNVARSQGFEVVAPEVRGRERLEHSGGQRQLETRAPGRSEAVRDVGSREVGGLQTRACSSAASEVEVIQARPNWNVSLGGLGAFEPFLSQDFPNYMKCT